MSSVEWILEQAATGVKALLGLSRQGQYFVNGPERDFVKHYIEIKYIIYSHKNLSIKF